MLQLRLGKENVFLLERCPYFRGVLKEGFHCIYTKTHAVHIIPEAVPLLFAVPDHKPSPFPPTFSQLSSYSSAQLYVRVQY